MFTTNSFFSMDPFLDQKAKKTVSVLKDAIGKKGRYAQGLLHVEGEDAVPCWIEVDKSSQPQYETGDAFEVAYVSPNSNPEFRYTAFMIKAKPSIVTSPRSYNRTIKPEHAVYAKKYAKARNIRSDGHYLNDVMHSMMDEIVEFDTFDLKSIPDQ